MQSRLPHQLQKPERFQGYGFAAGVGTGHDQLVEIFPEPKVDRHDFLLIKERVACFFQHDFALRVENRRGGIHVACERGLCKDKIQVRKDGEVSLQFRDMISCERREIRKNHLDFLLLVDFVLPKLVVEADHAHRLDEDRGAGAGFIVNHARYRRAVLGFYGNAVAAVPHCDDVVPKIAAVGKQYGIQLCVDFCGNAGHLAAD